MVRGGLEGSVASLWIGASSGSGGTRAASPGRVRHGSTRGRRRAAGKRQGACREGQGGCCACEGGRGRLGGEPVGRGWPWCGHACKLLDSGPGRKSTGDCGQGRGSWCEGSTWGGSGRQGAAPGQGGVLLCCGFGTSRHGGGMPMPLLVLARV